MKLLATLITSLVICISSLTFGQKRTITATVTNVMSNKGKVSFALYQKEGFLTTPVMALNGTIKDGKSTVTFKDVPEGEYAVVCFHDANNNDKMDFDGGMPQENYGASNNVMTFGPPQYNNAKFTVSDKNVSLEIKF